MNLLEWTDSKGERDPFEAVFRTTDYSVEAGDFAGAYQDGILGRYGRLDPRFFVFAGADGRDYGGLHLGR